MFGDTKPKEEVKLLVTKPQFNVDKIEIGTFCTFKDKRYYYTFTKGLIASVEPFLLKISYLDSTGEHKIYEVYLDQVYDGTIIVNLIQQEEINSGN